MTVDVSNFSLGFAFRNSGSGLWCSAAELVVSGRETSDMTMILGHRSDCGTLELCVMVIETALLGVSTFVDARLLQLIKKERVAIQTQMKCKCVREGLDQM